MNFHVVVVMLALAKEDGNDEDMAEMIDNEINSLSSQLKELGEKLKVLSGFLSSFKLLLLIFFFPIHVKNVSFHLIFQLFHLSLIFFSSYIECKFIWVLLSSL